MSIAENSFGDNTTIHQGDNVYHYSSDGVTDRCLADLRSTDPRDDKIRIEQTKGGLLRNSYSWILENDKFKLWYDDGDTQGQLLWITGDPGKGKTMLTCGIIDELANQSKIENPESKIVLSYFFCQGTDLRINTAVAVLRGLLYLIIHQQPALISHIKRKYDISGKSLFEDVNAWTALSQIFIDVLKDTSINNLILVIDALDECEKDQAKLLAFILQHSSLHRVKWIVTSRNGLNIEQKMKSHSSQALLSLELTENEACISHAIDAYIKHSVSRLDLVRDDKVLQDDLKKAMRQKVNRTFLWVSLAMKELEHVESWEVLQVIDEIPSDLKKLYARMMDQILQLKRENPMYCKQLLSTVCATYRPLSLSELGFLSDLPRGISEKPEALRRVISMCGSFLTIRDGEVYLVHQSAKDYLSTEAFQTIFPGGVEKHHHSLFSKSLQGLSETLRRDLWDLNAAGALIDEAMVPDPDPLATTRYSCVYWVDHLCDSIPDKTWIQINDLEDTGIIHQFLIKKYLYWLEALSLQRSISHGVTALNKLEALMQNMEFNQIIDLAEIIKDARRFILTHRKVIEIAPLQLYASALLFSPTNSLIRCLFTKEEPMCIASKPVMDAKWGPCLQTLEGHEDAILSVACSADGQRLATASRDKMVKIWDYITGGCLLILKGHRGAVTSVVFSADCQTVVSASNDETIKMWDARVGNFLQTLDYNIGRVEQHSATLSSDGKLAASSSDRKCVSIWDLADTPLRILSVPACRYYCLLDSDHVVFSADSRQLASLYSDTEIFIWDITTKTHFQTLRGRFHHRSGAMAFSPNGQQFVSHTADGEVKIWSIGTGECVKTLADHIYTTVHVVFSPDGLQIASAASDGTIMIYDTSTGSYLQKIQYQDDGSIYMAFSANGRELVSASAEGVARIWSLDTRHISPVPETTIRKINHIFFSTDNRSITSLSAGEIKIWNKSDGTCSQILRNKQQHVHDYEMFSDNGQRFAFVERGRAINISSADAKQCIRILSGYQYEQSMTSLTPDGRYLVVGGGAYMVKIWDPTTGECLQTFRDVAFWIPIAYSPASQKFATVTQQSNPRLVKIWDIKTGECVQTLPDGAFWVSSTAYAYSTDSQKITTSTWRNNPLPVKIWDITTKEYHQTLNAGYLQTSNALDIRLMFFSPDGTLLGTVSEDDTGIIGQVKSWDVLKGTCLQTFQGAGDRIKIGNFSPDNQLMASYSKVSEGRFKESWGMIKIWDVATGACLVTLDVDPPIDSLSFDPLSNSRIHTNIGVMNLSLGNSRIPSKISSREVLHHGYGVTLDGMWIINGKERLVWVPPDYRNRATSVLESQIAIGVVARESNRLFLMKFINR